MLFRSPAESVRLGQAARAHVARHFDAAAQSAKLERLLLAAAAAPPGTALDFARALG